MTRSTPPKKAATKPSVGTARTFDNSIADIYERLAAGNGTARLVEVNWPAARQPELLPVAESPSAALRQMWPELQLPAKSLQPRGGPSGGAAGASAMIVTLFGLAPEMVRDVVRRMERQVRNGGNFRPVFLTDCPDSSAFRHAGFTHEYFPPAIYAAAEQAPLFHERFLRLWKKWKAGLLIDFSAPGYLAARVEGLEAYFNIGQTGPKTFNPRKKRGPEPRLPTTDVVGLRAEYQASGLQAEADSFVFYRILGNDLPPRHEVGQTLTNLRFMLMHEPPLAGCEKRWVLNRIVDPQQEQAIMDLLAEHGQSWLRIPFVLEEYARAGWDIASFPEDAFFLRGHYNEMDEYDQLRAQAHVRRFKNNYLINNNGARNAALRDGRGRAKWVLPWDGNCFLTQAAWAEITQAVLARPYLKYFTVPMSRTLDNSDLLIADYRPVADEEPQMLFRRDATEEFDENFYYGRRPKVELFYRLGIPGKWDEWPDDIWDLPRAARSPDAGTSGEAGWVARLFSGQTQLEADKTTGLRSRGEARIAAITQMLDRLDVAAMDLSLRPEALVCYDDAAIGRLSGAEPGSPEDGLHQRLLQEADLALLRGPHSVVDKTAAPPSGDPHDYYHPAPYWWPNPNTPNGMPFLFRDGERIPGTRLYELESARYDRTRLQRMFDDTTVLALGWLASGREAYIDHAARNLRVWFLDEATRMNPHLLFSQVRSQSIDDIGAKSGLIEMKDIYYLLDAVRLVERAGRFSKDEKAAFRAWLRTYLEWLQTSEQGVEERLTNNNHGTCFDLQTGSIAAFLGDRELLERTFFTSRERILEQFTKEGRQPHEMKRTQTAHYCCFNLQCWINLCTLADACGHDLWSFEGPDGRGLARAFGWLLPHLAQKTWKYEQIEPFDRGRFLPLFFAARARIADDGSLRMTDDTQARAQFFPHDGVKPFWMLARAPQSLPRTGAWAELAEKLRKLEQPVFDLGRLPFRPRPMAGDLADLNKKLWGGFSVRARAALTLMRDGADVDARDRTRSAVALARWSYVRGDLEDVLRNTDAMTQLGVAGERERALLRSDCLARLGRGAEAADELQQQMELFPRDAGLTLAMANALRIQGFADQGQAQWSGMINRIYRNAGLPDYLQAGLDGAEAWSDPITVPARPTESGEGDAAAPLVSVLMVVPPGASYFPAALKSIQGQTWPQMQILVADCSGEARISRLLSASAKADPRLTVFPMHPGTDANIARNQMLRAVQGAFVTTQGADEIAHPDRIDRQVAALRDDGCIAVLAQSVNVAPDGQLLAAWTPGFGFVSDAKGSLMARTETLQSLGGWDSVAQAGSAFLLWRIRRLGDAAAIRTVLPGVPLLAQIGVVADGQPTHVDFPYGRAQNQLRRLVWQARRAAAVDAGAPPQPVQPLTAAAEATDGKLDVVFVGDFAAKAVAIEQIRARVLSAAAGEGRVGLFHWPDCRHNLNTDIDESLTEAVDDGRLLLVGAFEDVKAIRLVLCNPYLANEPIDGLPDFEPDRFEVLFGPELHLEEFDDGDPRRLPSRAAIEGLTGRPFVWMSL